MFAMGDVAQAAKSTDGVAHRYICACVDLLKEDDCNGMLLEDDYYEAPLGSRRASSIELYYSRPYR